MMSSKVEACPDCTKRCLQLHRKAKNSSTGTSFFKVMLGDLFSQVLYFPPMFAATVPMLANKKVVLEDSLGQQWKVTVSDCDGSLAFKKGWSAFSSEHSLENGDFVIFNHIMNLHFKVSIYTKTGCEKVEFAKKGNTRKRTRGTHPVLETTKEGLKNPQDSGTSVGSGSNVALSQDKCNVTGSRNVDVNRDKRPKYQSNDECHKPLCKTENFDDSYNFINRNKDVALEENRGPLVDLFSMEIPITSSFINESATNKVAGDELNPNCASTSRKAAVPPVSNAEVFPLPQNIPTNEIIDKSQCFEETNINKSVSDNDSCHDKTIEVPFITSATNSDRNMELFSDTPSKDVNECQDVPPIYCTPSTITRHDQEPHQKHTFPTDDLHSAKHECTPISMEAQNFPHGDTPKIIKTEPLTEVDKHEDLIKQIWEPKLIKEESLAKSNKIARDGNGVTNNAIPAPISCIVAKDTPSFLELPTSLQLSCSRGRKSPEKKRLVFIRDPEKRLWPMLYHEMPNVQVLTSGWEAFCSVNQIKPGDECLFQVEDENERIYQVIIRKCSN